MSFTIFISETLLYNAIYLPQTLYRTHLARYLYIEAIIRNSDYITKASVESQHITKHFNSYFISLYIPLLKVFSAFMCMALEVDNSADFRSAPASIFTVPEEEKRGRLRVRKNYMNFFYVYIT